MTLAWWDAISCTFSPYYQPPQDRDKSRATRDEPAGHPHRRDQAGWIGKALAGDVECGSVRHAGTHDRQAEGHVHRAVEADGLERDVPLVMIHGHDGVVCAAECMIKERVVGERAHDVDPFGPGSGDGGGNRRQFFVAEKPLFAGVWVKRRHGNPRRLPGGQWPHRAVGKTDLGEHRSDRDETEDLLERNVQRHVNDAEAGACVESTPLRPHLHPIRCLRGKASWRDRELCKSRPGSRYAPGE